MQTKCEQCEHDIDARRGAPALANLRLTVGKVLSS